MHVQFGSKAHMWYERYKACGMVSPYSAQAACLFCALMCCVWWLWLMSQRFNRQRSSGWWAQTETSSLSHYSHYNNSVRCVNKPCGHPYYARRSNAAHCVPALQ